jgi:hypothetical protein
LNRGMCRADSTIEDPRLVIRTSDRRPAKAVPYNQSINA